LRVGGASYVRIGVAGGTAERREWAAAEAFAAGALGAEEPLGPAAELWLYADAAAVEAVLAAIRPFEELHITAPEPVPLEAWPETWKRGLAAIVVSPRLLVRPSFVPAPEGFSGQELLIEPGQAFGTGGHASTLLALEALAGLPEGWLRGRSVLDVGCGSGVLALAALALGAERALGCDVDPLATAAARAASRANGLATRLALFTGSLDALGSAATGAFDVGVANLLRRELEPLLGALVACLRPGGRLLLAGLLVRERAPVEAQLEPLGCTVDGAREIPDPDGEGWLGLSVLCQGGRRDARNHSRVAR
jgi:ribosomal protein L11 methyltransferase